jgi:flagellar protein FliJ
MKRFEFRLRSVQVLRQRRLSEAEQRYALTIQQRREREGRMLELQQGMEAMSELSRPKQGARLDAVHQQAWVGSLHHLRARLQNAERELELARSVEGRAREQFVAAKRDHEVLERLKEKQKQAHFQSELLKEQALQDDLFNARRAIIGATKLS